MFIKVLYVVPMKGRQYQCLFLGERIGKCGILYHDVHRFQIETID